jgi:sec-independent protein translocase protein TatA
LSIKEEKNNMFGLGFQEILLLLLIALLLFGASRLPEIGRALGKTIKEFKKAVKEEEDDNTEKKDKNKLV